jgi:thiamine phosphate synthase YjbQ (UPF0047 family)
MVWLQKTITLTAPKRGCHLVTENVEKQIKNELAKVKIGIAHFFIQHTSAALTINEVSASHDEYDHYHSHQRQIEL